MKMKSTLYLCSFFSLLLLTVASAGEESQPVDLSTVTLGDAVQENLEDGEKTICVPVADALIGKAVRILEIDQPAVTGPAYALVGEVRYEKLGEGSFLETWNHLGANAESTEITQSFFSRTLAPSGPLGVLEGDSDWRDFQLPAYITDGSNRDPLKLTFNVYLGEGSDGGWVEMRNLRLVQLPSTLGAATAMGSGTLRVLLIAMSAGLGVLASAGVFLTLRLRRHQELRRIQAADM